MSEQTIRSVGVLGASGWIGSHLRKSRDFSQYRLVPFSRQEREGFRQIPEEGPIDFGGLDAIINLAGESIEKRWTEEHKKRMVTSRVDFTRRVVESLGEMEEGSRPRILLNASAIGYYGNRGEEEISEGSKKGEGFLADLCEDWEAEANKAAGHGVKVCLVRTGIVLGKGGGAWKPLSRVFKLGIGGRLGDGEQWMPWIHLDDEIGAMAFCLKQELTGPVNLTAPGSVRNKTFTKMVGQAVNRPTIFPAPAFALKMVLGEFAEHLLGGAKVEPGVLKEAGFEFRYPSLSLALGELSRE